MICLKKGLEKPLFYPILSYQNINLIFVFKTHYLYITLGLISIETECNWLNMIPMLLVVGDQTREEVIKNHALKMCKYAKPSNNYLFVFFCK